MKKEFILIIFCLINLHLLAWTTPSLSSPANGSTQWAGVNLDWGAVLNSDNYEVQIDTTMNFNSPMFQNQIENYINSSNSNSDTQHFVDDLLFGTTYYWRVRSWVTNDTSAWSVVRSFNVRDYVSLTSPANGASEWTGTNFDWYAHDGVDLYQLELDTSANFNSPALQTHQETYINTSNTNSDTQEFMDNMYFGKTYYWRVRAINAVDTSDWNTRTIQTRDYVSLTSPANGASEWTGTNFDWYAHDGVDLYQLELDTNANFNSPALQTHQETYINTSNTNSDTQEFMDNMYFGKTYYWRVRAINAVDTSDWNTRTIQTRDYVSLTSPSNNSVNISTGGTNLNWYAHHGVDYYDLEWDTTNLFNSSALQSIEETYINTSNSNSDTDHSSGILLANQTYHWRVRARNAVDTSAWTSRVFSTGSAITTPDIPVLVSPSNGQANVILPVNLDWNDANNALGYQIEYATSPTFVGAISSMSTNSELLNISVAQNQVYYWRVRSLNGGFYSDWSDVWSFNTNVNSCNTSSSASPSACSSYTSPSGNVYTSSGIYYDTIVNSAGCDSVITIYLTVIAPGTSTESVTTCGSYFWNGQTYSNTGVFTHNIVVGQGCDSIATLDLTIYPNYDITETVSTCEPYTWSNGQTYTTSGIYTQNLTTQLWCDSILTLDLTILPLDVSTTANGPNLEANYILGTYQWIDCATMQPIAGATSYSYTATANGDYAVIVTDGGCSDTSDCINVSGVSIGELNSEVFEIYPNPTNGDFTIEFKGNYNEVKIQITNNLGQLISQTIYDTSTVIHSTIEGNIGYYFIRIIADDQTAILKIFKR